MPTEAEVSRSACNGRRTFFNCLIRINIDLRGLACQFERWSVGKHPPWFEDQVYSDAALLARFRGEDIDVNPRLPSEMISDAIEANPWLVPVVEPYLANASPAQSLRVVEGRVRGRLRSGWRPQFASGPFR